MGGSLTGKSSTIGSFTLRANYASPSFIVKSDSSGNAVWAEIVGDTTNMSITGLAVNDSGKIYLTGYFNSSEIMFGNIIMNSNSGNLFVLSYDENGNLLWGTNAAQSANNYWDYTYSKGIATNHFGDLYIAGNFSYPKITFGNYTIYNSDTAGESSDIFIAMMSLPTGILTISKSNNILIYPNPTPNAFHLITSNLDGAKLNIYNILGEIVEQTVITNPNSEINLSYVPAGMYFVQVQDGASVYNGKVVKGPQK
jgi:hypothetical protein